MSSDNTLELLFAGGAGDVTGANFLLQQPASVGDIKMLVDCGLHQGDTDADARNWEPFPYDPSEIDVLVITHAHIDHIGRIPKLVHEGFSGRIISTAPTKAIAEVMLEDTAHIVTSEHEDNETLAQMYSAQTRARMHELWDTLAYDSPEEVASGFTVTLVNAGHILGSALVHIAYNSHAILFTGDLGNTPSPILPEAATPPAARYVVTESVYGNRKHENVSGRKEKLARLLQRNHDDTGILMMPVFSLERTQELLYEMDDLFEEGVVPSTPVFLDSPLAIKLTRIYQKFDSHFNESAQKQIRAGDDVFSFPSLTMTETPEASKRIRTKENPKVVMAGAGMSTGGRILFHERDFLSDPRNTLLFTGYQVAGTLGRKIQEGVTPVEILGQEVPVHARTETIRGYSGHKDTDQLVDYLQLISGAEKIFTAMGEPQAALFLAQRIRDELGVEGIAPEEGQLISLPF